jgi:hypothetical protein
MHSQPTRATSSVQFYSLTPTLCVVRCMEEKQQRVCAFCSTSTVPTSRSLPQICVCMQVCKSKIDKDVLRIGTSVLGDGDYMMTSWRHLLCQKKPKTGLDDLNELKGIDQLEAEDRKAVEAWFNSAGAGAGGKKRTHADAAGGGSSAGVTIPPVADVKKMKPAELKAALEAYGLPSGGKKAEKVARVEEVAKKQEAVGRFSATSVSALKDMLEANEQKKSGNKEELVERCVDGFMYGQLPRCRDCGAGYLRVRYDSQFGHGGQGTFSCPGFFDDDQWKSCKFSSTSLVRKPWVDGGAPPAAAASSTAPAAAPKPKKAKKSAGGSSSAPDIEVRMPGDDE